MTQAANQGDRPGAAELAGTADEMQVLRSENAVLRERVTRQNEVIGALEARILDLERRLGLNSSNSGKPPSSDGLKKPARVKSSRGRSGKRTGGQKGHPGDTLRQVATPDTVIDHYPAACMHCGTGLTTAMAVSHARRQVFERIARGLAQKNTKGSLGSVATRLPKMGRRSLSPQQQRERAPSAR
jgi:transposase